MQEYVLCVCSLIVNVICIWLYCWFRLAWIFPGFLVKWASAPDPVMKRGKQPLTTTTTHFSSRSQFLLVFFLKSWWKCGREEYSLLFARERELFHNTGFFQHLHPYAGLSGPAFSGSGRGTKKDNTEKWLCHLPRTTNFITRPTQNMQTFYALLLGWNLHTSVE